MARVKNPFGKSRPLNEPYAIYRIGEWEWKVLKTYRHPSHEAKDPYARWFCGVLSPHTYGNYELGDTYARSNNWDAGVMSLAPLVACTSEWLAAYGPTAPHTLAHVKLLK